MARVERDRARFEEHRATEVASFLQGILGAGDPTWSSPTRIAAAKATVAQVLDSAALRLPRELSDEPIIRASLHRTIAKAYLSQSRLAEAGAQLDSALAIHRQVFGADNGEVATDLYFHAPTAVGGGLDSVEQAMSRAIVMMRRNRPDTIASYVPAVHDLAYIKSARGQLTAAESLFTKVIEEERARKTPRQALLAITYGSLGLTYWNEGKQAPGVDYMKHGIALFDSLETPSPVELSNALPTLATALVSIGKAADALPYLERAKAVTTQVYGPNAPGLVQIGVSLGDAYLAKGDTARADREALAGITLGEHLPPGNEAERFQAEWTYARSLRKQRRFVDAERFGRRQYALALRSVKEVPYFWADATFLLGAILFDNGKAKEGEPYLLDSYRVAHDKLGPQHVRTLRVLPLLVTTYDALKRPSESERYRALMPDSMRVRVDSVRNARS
jgi:tetratricopeptide (TPR) repeat protein